MDHQHQFSRRVIWTCDCGEEMRKKRLEIDDILVIVEVIVDRADNIPLGPRLLLSDDDYRTVAASIIVINIGIALEMHVHDMISLSLSVSVSFLCSSKSLVFGVGVG